MSRPAPEYHYVAYIDESGDPGLKTVKPRTPTGSSEWVIVAGAVIQAEVEPELRGWIAEMMRGINSHQLRDIHFQKLPPHKKAYVCSYVAQQKVRLFAIISNKQNMEGYFNPDAARIPSDNWFYCWLTRVLLERITDYVLHRSIKRYGEPKRVKLEFSERGGLRYSQMKAYYEWINLKSVGGKVPLYLPWGKIAFEVLHRDLMYVYNHLERDGLKLPDIAASAFFKAVDVHDTRQCDPTFAKLLEPRMARAPHTGQIGGYGVKLMPNWRTLDKYKVPEEQRAILRFYGYPKDYWWQVEAVDPGPV
ncbi:MAG TPA: DUF3800 domain-containing protein [Microvirga sp.]|jgi:hypothetical protein|nr:DUF3800 domain-containing protein [Microvirga sp.]